MHRIGFSKNRYRRAKQIEALYEYFVYGAIYSLFASLAFAAIK
jgi:hypothetical protein